MQIFRAAWIVPIERAPIRDGWVAVDHGRVVALGKKWTGIREGATGATAAREVTDLGSVAVMPGLVNAHTHLELSWLRGQLPTGGTFPDWIRSVVMRRRQGPVGGDAGVRSAVSQAIDECRRSGTLLIGDIANTMMTVGPLSTSPLHAVIFRELIGFRSGNAAALADEAVQQVAAQPQASNVRLTLAAHAPYSVSPLLFRAIKSALARDPFAPSSVHLGESVEEVTFLKDGSGPWRSVLDELDAWDPVWVAPACDPVEYLDRMGFLDDRLLCVHGVHLDGAALQRLARRSATIVTCPRGNRLTGAGCPPIAAFYAAGLRVAVGTDSLASVPDLNVFSELAELRRVAPEIPAARLLESATWNGARALGWDTEFGTIEPGRRAAIISVTVPNGTADVEEYLVGGIQPEQIRWIT